jgi:hypothetical protein
MATNAIPHIEEGNARAEVKRWTSRSEAKELRGIAHIHSRMRSTRWDPITLISFHPWPLHASGYVHHDLRIPPAPLPSDETAPRIQTLDGRDLTYAIYAFTDYKVDGIPNESGDRTFEEMLPLSQALDYVYQHNNSMRNNVGGMFCYVGVEPPNHSLGKEAYVPTQNAYLPENCARMTVKEAIERVHADQLAYYMKQLDEANDIFADEAKSWRKGQRRSEITPNMRKIVTMCRAWGVIATDPEWFTAKRTGKDARPPRECPSCGFEAKPKAVRCTNGTCSYVFDAFEAFEKYVIGLDTPGAGLAFRRLTEAQIKHLIKGGMFTREALTAANMPGFEKEEKKVKAKTD